MKSKPKAHPKAESQPMGLPRLGIPRLNATPASIKAGGIKKMGPRKIRPPLQLPEQPNPMEGVELNDDTADQGHDASAVLGAAGKAFNQRGKDERASMELTTDGAFYFCAIFDTREQKMAFLKAAGLADEGDIFVDGRKLADNFGVEIPEVKARMPRLFRVDRKYHGLVDE